MIKHSGGKKSLKFKLLSLLFGGGILCASMIAAMNDASALRVTLKRIIFEGPVRTDTLTIVNNDSTEQTYRIGWKNMRMTEDKSLTAVKEGEDISDLQTADDMIRYAPRRITLPPGATQQIRLMLRRPRDLAPGEYRSHIWISPESSVEPFGQAAEPGKTSVQLQMLTGMTLPVFVRHGKMEVSGGMENARAVRNSDGSIDVSYTLTRQGNRSLYGDIEFLCASAGDVILRDIRGLSVYTEVTRRNLSQTIEQDVHENVSSCKSLTIRYIAEKKDPQYNGGVIAEATVPVN